MNKTLNIYVKAKSLTTQETNTFASIYTIGNEVIGQKSGQIAYDKVLGDTNNTATLKCVAKALHYAIVTTNYNIVIKSVDLPVVQQINAIVDRTDIPCDDDKSPRSVLLKLIDKAKEKNVLVTAEHISKEEGGKVDALNTCVENVLEGTYTTLEDAMVAKIRLNKSVVPEASQQMIYKAIVGTKKPSTVSKAKQTQNTTTQSNGKVNCISHANQKFVVSERFNQTVKEFKELTENGQATFDQVKTAFIKVAEQVQFLNYVTEIVSDYDIARMALGQIDLVSCLAFLAYYAKNNVIGKTGKMASLSVTCEFHKVYIGSGVIVRHTKASTAKFTAKGEDRFEARIFSQKFNRAEMIALFFEDKSSVDYHNTIDRIKGGK